MLHPLRVIIANRGPDTELLVANPIELSGNGRPRVFYDVTLALKNLGICIFSVSICWCLKEKVSTFLTLLILCEDLKRMDCLYTPSKLQKGYKHPKNTEPIGSKSLNNLHSVKALC